MKHIYVDYSVRHDNKGYGGVAVFIREGDDNTTHFFRTDNMPSDQGELLALMLGIKFAEEGDAVYTDQDFVVEHIMEYGEVRTGKQNTKPIPKRKRKLVHSLNTVLTFKKGISIVGVQRGHCGVAAWGHVDCCAKVAAGLRELCNNTWRFYKKHDYTVKYLMYV